MTKKPIDPNLDSGADDILFGSDASTASADVADVFPKAEIEPQAEMGTLNIEYADDRKNYGPNYKSSSRSKTVKADGSTSSGSHHSSSSGSSSHHSSSSSSHHSSNGEHSSSSHSSSSGEHSSSHHSSSGSSGEHSSSSGEHSSSGSHHSSSGSSSGEHSSSSHSSSSGEHSSSHHSSSSGSSSHHSSSSGEHSSSSHSSSSGEHSSSGSHHSSSGSSSSHHSSSGSSGSHHSSSGSHHSSSSGSHHSSSHSSKSKKKKKAKKIILIILLVILLLIAIVAITFYALYSNGKSNLVVEDSTADYEETIEYNGHTYVYNSNRVAFAFLGVDKESIDDTAEYDYGQSGQSDTDMVAVVDVTTGEMDLIVIPRDTLVEIDLYDTSGKFIGTEEKQICLAYAYGDGGELSCTNVTTAMSRVLLNVPIEKYFALDLSGISELNDAIGGVTLQSLADFEDEGISEGDTITIMGDFAETYVRQRSLDYIEASLARTERQKQYLQAYFEQLKSAVGDDFSVIADLYNAGSDYSQTNVTLSDITYMATVVISHGIGEYDTYTIDGEMTSVEADEEGVYAQYVVDEDSVMEIVLECFYTQVS